METAHDYALDFLRPLVERGYTAEEVCRYSRVSVCGLLWTIQIGGEVYFQGKRQRIKQQQLVVKSLHDDLCLEIFEVEALFAELGVSPTRKPQQLSLWQ